MKRRHGALPRIRGADVRSIIHRSASIIRCRDPFQPGTARPFASGPGLDLPAHADVIEKQPLGFRVLMEPRLQFGVLPRGELAVAGGIQQCPKRIGDRPVFAHWRSSRFVARSTHSSNVVRMRRSELCTLWGDRPTRRLFAAPVRRRRSRVGPAADRRREAGPCNATRRPARRRAGPARPRPRQPTRRPAARASTSRPAAPGAAGSAAPCFARSGSPRPRSSSAAETRRTSATARGTTLGTRPRRHSNSTAAHPNRRGSAARPLGASGQIRRTGRRRSSCVFDKG